MRSMHSKMTSFILFSICVWIMGCNSYTKYIIKLSSDDTEIRKEAIQSLGLLGPKALKSVDKLIPIIRREPDPEIRRLAVEAIGYIEPPIDVEISDALVLALNDQDVDLRRQAVVTVGRFTNFPPNLITILQKHLTDSDHIVRELVMSTFERIGLLGVRTLLRALEDKNPDMRLNAIVTLGRLGEYAGDAVETLKNLEGKDENEDVRTAASEALRVIAQ